MNASAVDTTHILKIEMVDRPEPAALHGHPTPKTWLGYTLHGHASGSIDFDHASRYQPTADDAVRDHGRPGDRLLDLDVRDQTGRHKFTFEVSADYSDHGKDYTVSFADEPFTFGWLGGPDLGDIFQNAEVSADGKRASFELDLDAASNWDVARHLRGVHCPVVRVPFRINLIDGQFPFPSWMMPEPGDPAYDLHDHENKGMGSMNWHGGPHPPIKTVVVIPTGA